MNNFLSLALPDQPVQDFELLAQVKHEGPYFIRPAEKIFRREVLDTFRNLGLKPSWAIMFDRGDFESTPEDRVIHRDITRTTGAPWDNSNVSDPANWRPMYCGVNWELTDSECEFSWFDMSALPEHYPNKIRDVDTRLNVLNGVHYGDRFMQGVIPGSRLLQTCIFSGPTLVRTDIPHLVLYRSLKKTRPRMAVSLRFHETWASWPDALKAFVPLSK